MRSPRYVVILLIILSPGLSFAQSIEFLKREVMDVTFEGDFHMQVFDFEDRFAEVLVGGDNGVYR